MVRLILLVVVLVILVLAVRTALGARRKTRAGELPEKRRQADDDTIEDADYTEV